MPLNGRQVVIEGGEYNMGSASWTTLGALGNITPWGNVSWVSNSPPSGWGTIGDAESIVLANGKYMQSNCCTAQNAIFNGPNSWLATGSVNQSSNDESGFTLLTNDKVLTVDAKFNCALRHRHGVRNSTIRALACGRADQILPSSSITPLMRNWALRS